MIARLVRFLEDYLSGQLKLTGRTKVADGKARCGDDAERGGSCRRAGTRVAEAGMIEEVEGIDSELEHQALGNLRVLIERHIDVGKARSACAVALHIAEASGGRIEDATSGRGRGAD
jgi:hypothetical protein